MQEPYEERARCMRNLFAKLGLLLASCIVGLSLCETSLRLFHPKYQYLAEAQFQRDGRQIFNRRPNSRSRKLHPDTLAPHSVYYNNLALRQHRNFSATDLTSATNIGVFGDSFTENADMAAQYSFTEPLDYLLNLRGQRVNVLNFGRGNYGTDKLFQYYEHFRYSEDLDHVLYVYCPNDLSNIHARGKFHLDEAGQLVWNKGIEEPWWVPLIGRLHMSYLILDAGERLPSLILRKQRPTSKIRTGEGQNRNREEKDRAMRYGFKNWWELDNDDQKTTLKIFRLLIRRWKGQVERNGNTFSVALLPHFQPAVVDLLTAEDVDVIDLPACFGAADPAYPRPRHRSPYYFKKDLHWNEAGNRLVAVCLYRVLREKIGQPRLSDGRLQEAIFQYYAAFRGKGEGKTAVGIREKYLALDLREPLKDERRKVMSRLDKPIITSVFDLYLDGNRLIYFKEDCTPTHARARFFLHVIPVDGRVLPEDRRPDGFENRDFSLANRGIISDRGCFASRQLPAYPIRQIRTGQFSTDAQGNYVSLWEVESYMDQGVGR